MIPYLLLLFVPAMLLTSGVVPVSMRAEPICMRAEPISMRAEVMPHDLDAKVQGVWSMSVQAPDIGFLQTRMTFAVDGGKTEGHSYDGGASVVANWFERAAAGATSGMFKNGALLHIMQFTPRSADSFAAAFSTPAGAVLMEGVIRGDSMYGRFVRDGAAVGWFTGSRNPESITLTSYPALAARMLDTLRAHVYDPTLTSGGAFADFADGLTTLGKDAREDAEVIMKFFRLRGDLPFSHCYLYREAPDALTKSRGGKTSEASAKTDGQHAKLDTSHSDVNILTIASFAGNGEDIDSVMQIVHQQHAQRGSLIIDLRGNSGGNVSATRLAKHLVRERMVVGTFITRRYMGVRTEPLIPAAGALPELETSNTDTLFAHLRKGPGLRLVVTPGPDTYTGAITILTDSKTASTCEPLVYAFKSRGLARVIGEKTAGAMLSAEPFALADGWKIVVPTADYFTHDGRHLDKIGVTPDVEATSEQALTRALQSK